MSQRFRKGTLIKRFQINIFFGGAITQKAFTELLLYDVN